MTDVERTAQEVLTIVKAASEPVSPATVISQLSQRGYPEGRVREVTRDLLDDRRLRFTDDRRLYARS